MTHSDSKTELAVAELAKEEEEEDYVRPTALYGVRHTQIILTWLLLTIAYCMRVNLSVAVVAMTDNTTSSNPDIPTYDWNDKSVVLSSFYWGYIILQIGAGHIGSKYGTRWLVVVAMVVNSILCMITPVVADNLGSKGVMGCRVVQGLFQGFVFPSVHNMLGKWAPKPERSTMSTFVFSGAPFGTIIAMPITGLISASWAGWPTSFYVFGAMGFAWTLMWILIGSNSPAEHKSISEVERNYIEKSLGREDKKVVETPWLALFTSLPVWAIVVGNFGQNWGYSTLITEIPNYMNKVMKFDMQSNSLLSAAPYLALFILCFVFGPISDYLINKGFTSRANTRKIMNTIGTCVPAVALIGLSYVPSDEKSLSVTVLIIVVGINAAVFCGYQVNHIDLSPNHAGVLMGLSNGSSNIFSIIAPLVVQAVVTDETDQGLWRIVFIISSVIYVASAIFFNIFAVGEVQPWNDIEEYEINQAIERQKKQEEEVGTKF